jgi:hypothetical protein
MAKRYDYSRVFENSTEEYKNILDNRGRLFINQYGTQVFSEVTDDIKLALNKVPHIWSSGDKYFVLSQKYYDDFRYWWLIAWFNNKPTEQHNDIGDLIYIPLPLNKALSYYYGG